jgi:putative ABC transport system permease protein
MRGRQIKKRKADLERKLRSDLEQEEEEQRESGMSPEEVRYAARGAFGNANPIRKQTH